MAEAEPLLALPAAPFPATVSVIRVVGDNAAVAFRGNAYSVPTGLSGTVLTLTHRLGSGTVQVASPAGGVLVSHRLAPAGAGALNTLLQQQLTPGREGLPESPGHRKDQVDRRIVLVDAGGIDEDELVLAAAEAGAERFVLIENGYDEETFAPLGVVPAGAAWPHPLATGEAAQPPAERFLGPRLHAGIQRRLDAEPAAVQLLLAVGPLEVLPDLFAEVGADDRLLERGARGEGLGVRRAR